MNVEYVDLAAMEPKVVDLTIDHERPEFSVRMPFHKLSLTHDSEYLEIRYRGYRGQVLAVTDLSPHRLAVLTDARKAMAELPLMQEAQVPHQGIPHLGDIENLYLVVKKLYDFHTAKKYIPLFQQYWKPARPEGAA